MPGHPIKTLACLILLAAMPVAGQDTTFRTTVPVVLVPTTVTDRHGAYVNGLTLHDFAVIEDGRPRQIQLDTADTTAIPMALIVLIQANNTAPTALLKIEKVGSMVHPLITGDRGHAAVMAFGSELQTVQDFTADPMDLTKAFHHVEVQGGKQARMVDAIAEAARMFGHRRNDERRVLFVIGESRDRGSNTRLKDAIQSIQIEGITVFPIVYSAYVTPFTTKASDMPPPGDTDLLGAITEPLRMGKTDTARELAQYSGGRKVSFATLHGLENIVTSLGEELHSQYILSYTNPSCEPGLHRIEVKVNGRPDVVVRARYGYWTDPEWCRGPAPAATP